MVASRPLKRGGFVTSLKLETTNMSPASNSEIQATPCEEIDTSICRDEKPVDERVSKRIVVCCDGTWQGIAAFVSPIQSLIKKFDRWYRSETPLAIH